MEEHSEAEGTVWRGHPSQWHYFGWWLLAVLLIAGSVAWFATQVYNPWFFLLDAAALAVVVGVFIARNRLTFTITPSKVIVEDGLIVKSSDELRIKDIRSIAVKKHGLSGLFGIGTIEFSTAATDDADVIFCFVSGVTAVRDHVRRYQESV